MASSGRGDGLMAGAIVAARRGHRKDHLANVLMLRQDNQCQLIQL